MAQVQLLLYRHKITVGAREQVLLQLVRVLLLQVQLVHGGLDGAVRAVRTLVRLFAAVPQAVSAQRVVVAAGVVAVFTLVRLVSYS